MVRFPCFPSSTAQHRSKVFLPADETTLIISQMNSQDQTYKSTTESSIPNQKTDDNSPFSHHECWRSENMNRCSSSDDCMAVTHLKKSQSLGNMLEKDREYHSSEDTERDVSHGTEHHFSSFKSSEAVEKSAEVCNKNTENSFRGSSDPICHESLSHVERQSDDICELSTDCAIKPKGHSSYAQPRFPRSQSAEFQISDGSDIEGVTNSETLGPRCMSFEDFCSMGNGKVDSKSNMGMHCAKSSSPDIYEGLGHVDAVEEGQRSSGSGEYNEVGDETLQHGYWNAKYACSDHSGDPILPYCGDSVHDCHPAGNSGGLNKAIEQEKNDKWWNGDKAHCRQSLVVDVPDSKDISEEAGQRKAEMNGNKHVDQDWNELTPKTFSIKRIEDWINQIDIENDVAVEEQGGSSNSSSTKHAELVASGPAMRPDAKSPRGMEIAYNYISTLTAASSSAQLANLGLVAVPILSAFSGLRLLNLSGNSIARVTPGALPKGLHMLSLSKNNISTIEGLRELTRLRVLDVSYNRISRIGHGLASCSSLKELYLAGNKISEVEGLHRLLKLKILDLRNNKISTSKGTGQLAANYNSLEAINLDGNPAQKNVGDEHLKKHLLSLLPNLTIYNKQSVRASGSKDVSDRHARKISSHRSNRGARSERKSSRLVGSTSAHKSQSSRHSRSGYASSSLLKPSRAQNAPMGLLGSKPTEYGNAESSMKRVQSEGKMV